MPFNNPLAVTSDLNFAFIEMRLSFSEALVEA